MQPQLSSHRRALLRAGFAAAAAAAAPKLFAATAPRTFFAGHGLPIGVQLYMLGEAATTDLAGTLQRVARIGYRAVELPGVQPDAAPAMRTAADMAGLSITSVHLGVGAASGKTLSVHDAPARIAAVLRALGCRDAVLPFPVFRPFQPPPGEDPVKAMLKALQQAGAEPWQRTATLLNERARLLRSEGVALSYHNHNLEFLPVGDRNGWKILADETDPALVSFEVDVGWVVAGGVDPVTFLQGLAGRVRQVHVKDLRAVEQVVPLSMASTEVGSGAVDWRKVLPAAYAAGARQFYVEQEPPYALDRFEAAAKSFSFLSQV